jgi:hypothetical protein
MNFPPSEGARPGGSLIGFEGDAPNVFSPSSSQKSPAIVNQLSSERISWSLPALQAASSTGHFSTLFWPGGQGKQKNMSAGIMMGYLMSKLPFVSDILSSSGIRTCFLFRP